MARSRFETRTLPKYKWEALSLQPFCPEIHFQMGICVLWIFWVRGSCSEVQLHVIPFRKGQSKVGLVAGAALLYSGDLLLGWIVSSTFFLSCFCRSSRSSWHFRFSIYIPSQSSGSRPRLMHCCSLLSLSVHCTMLFSTSVGVGRKQREKIYGINKRISERNREKYTKEGMTSKKDL